LGLGAEVGREAARGRERPMGKNNEQRGRACLGLSWVSCGAVGLLRCVCVEEAGLYFE
jgi:hypothetical protein